VAWLVAVVLASSPGVAWGADAEDLRRDYLRALARLEEGRGGSLERVFESGRAAARAQVASATRRAGGADGPVLREVVLPGFHFGPGDALGAGPDPSFFLDLARRRGTAVDREFFTLLRDTYYRNGLTRLYTVPWTDVSVCHVFDHPDVDTLYRSWTRFWATHPRAYPEVVDQEVKALEDMMARSTCACGDRESVETGLAGFLKSFPRSPVALQVRTRLEHVRAGTGAFRYRCPTG
jgi:hypothetical protein